MLGVGGRISGDGGSAGNGGSVDGGAGLWKSGRGRVGVDWASNPNSAGGSFPAASPTLVAANPIVGVHAIISVEIVPAPPIRAEPSWSFKIDVNTKIRVLVNYLVRS